MPQQKQKKQPPPKKGLIERAVDYVESFFPSGAAAKALGKGSRVQNILSGGGAKPHPTLNQPKKDKSHPSLWQ
jgi:hypothetical protein